MTDTHHTEESRSFTDVLFRLIAVLGLVAVLLLGAWGIIQVAFVLPDFFAKIFNTADVPSIVSDSTDSLILTAPNTAISGQSFAVSWEHAQKEGAYGYQISYSCADGLLMHTPAAAGGYQTVPCNTPFNFTNATETLLVTPTLSGKTEAPVTFTIFANRLSDNIVTAVGSTTLLVLPASAPKPAAPIATKPTTVKPTPKPATTYVAAPRAPTLYGSADLSVQILSTQVTGSRYTMQFVVTNIGTNTSAAGWTFTALLPLNPVYTYTSGAQQALYPGDKIIYTMGFDVPQNYQYQDGCGYQNYEYGYTRPTYTHCNNTYNPYQTNYSYNRNVTITVDAQNYTSDYNRGNNTASTQI